MRFSLYLQHRVLMAQFVLPVILVAITDHMEGLKFVSIMHGAPSVMTSGMPVMLVWCADNWDTPPMVSSHISLYYTIIVELPKHNTSISVANPSSCILRESLGRG